MDLDLCGEVVAGVDLGEHVHRRELRVAQVGGEVGVVDAPRDGLGIVTEGEHLLAFAANDHRGAGVLAHGQHTARGDVGVLEQLGGHEAVVVGGVGVFQDVAELLEVAGPQVVVDVVHGDRRQQRSASGSTFKKVRPAASTVETPSVDTSR